MASSEIDQILRELSQEKKQVNSLLTVDSDVRNNTLMLLQWYENRIKAILNIDVLISKIEHDKKKVVAGLFRYILELLEEGKKLTSAGKKYNAEHAAKLQSIKSTMQTVCEHLTLG